MISAEDFGQVMVFLREAYPRQEITDMTVEVYYQVLRDLPLDQLKAAVLDLISSDTPWMPAAGQVRARAFDLALQEAGLLTAGEAWAEVKRVVRKHYVRAAPPVIGWNEDGSPQFQEWGAYLFSSPLVYNALESVGGPDVFQLPIEVEHTTRARFQDAYKILVSRERDQARRLPQVREVVKALARNKSLELPEEIE